MIAGLEEILPAPSMIDHALSYARRNWFVFPVVDKAPLTKNGHHDATLNEQQIRAWWTQHPDANIGIAVGPSRICILDVDVADGKCGRESLAKLEQEIDLPKTRTANTGSGGLHFIYTWPEGVAPVRRIRFRPGLDWLGEGYFVAPPSMHASGRRYEWIDPSQAIVDAPAELVRIVGERPETAGTAEPYQGGRPASPALLAHARDRLREHGPSIKGQGGDQHAYQVGAVLLGGYDLQWQDAWTLAKEWRDAFPENTWSDEKLAKKLKNGGAYAQGHRGDLRINFEALQSLGFVGADPAAAGSSERPSIRIRNDQAAVTDEAAAALAQLGGVYVRGRSLVHVVRDVAAPGWLERPEGAPVIEALPRERLRELMGIAANWVTVDREGKSRRAMVPPWVVETLTARGQWPFPALEGVADSPVLRPNGSILSMPGYDPATRLIYAPGGVRFPPVAETPTQADAARALAEIMGPLVDFPFVAPSDGAATIAAILSVIGRGAIDGCVPMFAIGAPVPGAGKGLLADLAAIVATGRAAPKMAATTDDDETRKRLLALAIESPATVLIDNVEGAIGSASLAMALTAGEIRDRVLGATRIVTASLRPVWLLTGNNVQLRGDLGRRVVPIDIDPRVEHPEDRTGFRHPDLLAHVRRSRPALVCAALTILRAHAVAGRPGHGGSRKGSFEQWDDVVRSAVIWSGGADPLGGVSRIREAGDDDLETLRALLRSWAATFPDGATSGDAIKLAMSHTTGDDQREFREALEAVCRDGRISGGTVGAALRARKGRVVDGQRFVSGLIAGRNVWRAAGVD